MIWCHPATPASKVYADGKLCLRAPDGTVMSMAEIFNANSGYESWMTNMVPYPYIALFHLQASYFPSSEDYAS